jgi:tellurite resistance protein
MFKKECRIKYFPISFFSVILGMAGFTIAFQKMEEMLKLPVGFSFGILIFTLFLFGAMTFFYLWKMLFFGEYVLEEFQNPIKLSFFPTFSISLLLLSISLSSVFVDLSRYFWWTGSIIHILFTLKIVSIWIHHTKFEIKHMNPAWFIPAVGNVLIPVVGVKYFIADFSWFFYSVGLFFWIILLVIFFNRIIFHHPLPEKLLPTLFILIAPPAVAFISLVKLTGEVSVMAKILYYFALFLLLLLFFQFKMFKKIKFYLSCWAYSFPIAAITIASVLMYHHTEQYFFYYLSIFLFDLLSILIFVLLYKSIFAILNKEICVEE